jgi:hypothetical protein
MRNGIRICKPTGSPAIVVAGSGSQTATIVGQGSVEFANATSLSLNGVFTSAYDNYMIVVRNTASAGERFEFRLRAGTDASGSNYVRQSLNADSTAISADRATMTSFNLQLVGTSPNGWLSYWYGPNLAQPTAFRGVSVSSRSSGYIVDQAGTHSLATAYDGFSMIAVSCNITGLVSVYGLVN